MTPLCILAFLTTLAAGLKSPILATTLTATSTILSMIATPKISQQQRHDAPLSLYNS
ncbi:hypothetical protein [Rickettsia oklahomensis]|uniref:Uncharacterized protein n=1 Tax=Rickettsia oklahomensis TaxID=3141789 RepID=A0AAU7C000_9RICK